jgi:hypothetical protein
VRKGRKSDAGVEPGSGPFTRPRTHSLVDGIIMGVGGGKRKRSSSGVSKRDMHLYDDGYDDHGYDYAHGSSHGGKGKKAGGGTNNAIQQPVYIEPPEAGEDPEYVICLSVCLSASSFYFLAFSLSIV